MDLLCDVTTAICRYEFIAKHDGAIRFYYPYYGYDNDSIDLTVEDEIKLIMAGEGYRYLKHYTIDSSTDVELTVDDDNVFGTNVNFWSAVSIYFCDLEEFTMMKLKYG